MDRFIAALRQFGIGRLAAILGVSAGVAAVLAVMVFHLGNTPMSLLYSDVDPKEASNITAALDQAGVKYELSGDGTTIKVPADKVASSRVLLAGKGVSVSASMGYELFDKQNALGQTDFVQNLNAKRALEGELARTIASIQGVNNPRVTLVLPKRELFQENAEEPKASILIGFTRAPSAETVRAIQNLVASGVPGLKPEKVTIADATGKLLSNDQGADAVGAMAAERRAQAEKDLEHKIQAQLDSMLGSGHAKVVVNAELDPSQTTVSKMAYDPDGNVVRSSQTGETTARETNASPVNTVTAANNIPGGVPAPGAEQSGSQNGETTELTNFMNSSTQTTQVTEAGQIKRLSVSVAVDGVTGPAGKDGKPGPYTPRSAAEMQQIEGLVKAAMGFSQDRNDQVTVSNIKFARADLDGGTAAKPGLLSGFGKDDLMRGVEYLILLVVAVLTVFFVARPLFKTMNGGGAGGMGGGMLSMPMLAGAGAGGGTSSVNGSMGADMAQLALANASGGGGGGADGGIDIARIEGQVKASAVKQVSEFVDRHPDESVSILRSWLHDA